MLWEAVNPICLELPRSDIRELEKVDQWSVLCGFLEIETVHSLIISD